ncbi:MAG: hypothetical protein IIC90_14145, partial [Chloroflexi bacterium]|nr:hypothetical protein [Chloroflexota bacterium]
MTGHRANGASANKKTDASAKEKTGESQTSKPRGGRRPGAGAPIGNLNALKTGRYSRRLTALRAALQAMPKTAGLLAKATARDRRKMEMLAYGLQSYAEMLLLIAAGGSIDDLAEPQLRKRALYAIPIKQSAIQDRSPDG